MAELTATQREARALGLGGSDAAAACGISKWKTPVELWLEKTGQSEPPNLDDVEIVQWGKLLEDVIAQEWARRHGREIRRSKDTRVDPEFDFMRANIDRDVVGLREGLECKNSSAWLAEEWGENGTDEVPLYYLIQGAHYMRVWDYDAWNFAVLLGGNELRSYRILRDETVEKNLIDLESTFWSHVLDRTPPDPVTIDDLVHLYPKGQGVKAATEEIQLLVHDLADIKAEIKRLEAAKKEKQFTVCEYLGEASDLLDAADPLLTIATWRSQNQNRFDVTRFRKDDPSTAEAYTLESTIRRFLVK